jgi:hypothetical protein
MDFVPQTMEAGGVKLRPYKISPFYKGGHRGIFYLAGTEASPH